MNTSDLDRLRRLAGTDPHRAYDEASTALAGQPEEVALRQIQAAALIQTASLGAAFRILDALYAAGNRDAETLGLLGSVWKRRAGIALDPQDRRAALARARDYYLEGLVHAETHADPAGHYPGINAATLTLLLGDEAAAGPLAARATALACRAPAEDFWAVATRAEAALVQRDLPGARALYTRAASLEANPARRGSARRQARRIAEALGLDRHVIDDCLPVPPVLLFVGHLTDAPGRKHPRFPESLVPEAAARLRAAIEVTGGSVGFASAARGGDLLFLEALQTAGIETRIVLPLEREPFCAASVGDPAWEERFSRALDAAQSLRIANTHSSAADGAAFEYGTRLLLGLARLQAAHLGTELRALTLWDGAPGDGHGGTAWAVNLLRERGVPVENLFPGKEGPVAAGADPAASAPAARPIRAMLFADCKGYSKLREEQVATFTQAFLQGVARLIEHLRPHGAAPLVANTWGDGLYMVFADVRGAGRFALALRDGVRRRAAELGLPEGVAVRIGLHAGPVTPIFDPIVERPNFVGQNVAFAARIEPIAPENQVCVSEAFAALAAEAGHEEFRFDYLGVTAFAKGFGHYPLYQLRPAAEHGLG